MLQEAALRGHKRRLRTTLLSPLLIAAAICSCAASLAAQDRWKNRDAWQRPEEVMDALGAKAGSAVADIGAGRGYFTFLLAKRVGPEGKVYAVDIDAERVQGIRARAEKEGLQQIAAVVGAADDPRLPATTLDAILVVNAYHEMAAYDAMLQAMRRALKPGGVLLIIDHQEAASQPRSAYQRHHTIPENLVLEDLSRNGFQFVRKGRDLLTEENQTWFFLVFVKPAS